MKQDNNIRDSLNENLSGLYVSRQQHAALMNEITGGKKVKKKMTASLILVMVLVLLAAAALAWGLRYSSDVTAANAARSGVMEKYGLSHGAMDMFFETIEKDGQNTTVRLAAHNMLAETLPQMGVYTVTISKNGSMDVQWSHDDAEPSAWASGSLEDEVWKNEQILAYREKRNEENRLAMEHHTANNTADPEEVDSSDTLPVGKQAKLTEAQVLDIAKVAMKETFLLSDETIALFDAYAGFGETEEQALQLTTAAIREMFHFSAETDAMFDAYGKGSESANGLWTVVYHPTFVVKELFISKFDQLPFGNYVVTVSDATGEALRAQWLLQGKDDKTYTESTWGQADAYDHQALLWALSLMDICQPIMEKDQTLVGSLSVGDKAAFDQAFRDAGFDAAYYNHVLPQTGDVSYEQAVEIVEQSLNEAFDVSRAVFDASVFAYADLQQLEDYRVWYFWAQNHEEQCSWTVIINAQTGEILELVSDPYAYGNG